MPGGEEMPDEKWDLLIAILQEVAFPVPSRSHFALPELSASLFRCDAISKQIGTR